MAKDGGIKVFFWEIFSRLPVEAVFALPISPFVGKSCLSIPLASIQLAILNVHFKVCLAGCSFGRNMLLFTTPQTTTTSNNNNNIQK